MTPDPQRTDWSQIEKVFELLETDERKLTKGEKQLIAGQRRINGILFDAINAILKTLPDDSFSPAIAEAKDLLKDLPGKEPPGCRNGKTPDPEPLP